jgi:hypothetical protein
VYCTRCGTYNSEELTFCRNCSAQLTRPGEARRAQSPPRAAENPYPYATPPSGHQSQEQPNQNVQPYPGYRSAYSGSQAYQPYQSSYAGQVSAQSGSASNRSIASLVLSVISIATCGPLFSIPGMILGKMEMNAIRDGQAPIAGETFAKFGFYIGLCLNILYFLGMVVFALLALMGISGGAMSD